MCNNKDSVEAYLRDRWAQHAPLWWQDARGARCTARRGCVLSCTGSLSSRGTDQGTQHACLQRLPAKALVPGMLPQGLNGTGAPVRHSRALSIYPSRSHNFPAILVNPGNPSLFDYRTGNPTQSESIHHYYILLHIIKIIFILTHLLALVGQILSTRAASSLQVVIWSGCPS